MNEAEKFNAEAKPPPTPEALIAFWQDVKTGDAYVTRVAAFLDKYPEAVTAPVLECDDWGLEAGVQALHVAARYGDSCHEAMIGLLLARGAPPDGRDPWGRTPLVVFASWHSGGEGEAAFKALLDGGANPDAQDGEGRTALHHIAANFLSPAKAQLLLDKGANPNLADLDGFTPLMTAVEAVSKDYACAINFWPRPEPAAGFVKALLDHGARATDAAKLAKKGRTRKKEFRAAFDAIIDKARIENAESVAAEADQLAEQGIARKIQPMTPLKIGARKR